MELDPQTLNLARSMFPPVAGERDEGSRNLLETALTSLVAMQLSANTAALALCATPDGDQDLDALALLLRNQMRLFHHFVDVYRGLRDKPEVMN